MHRMKVTGWKKVFHTNRNEKKAGVAVCITDKIDFKLKTLTRDREGHYIMTKWSIHQEDVNSVSVYEPNFRTLKYLKQILTDLKWEIDLKDNRRGQ